MADPTKAELTQQLTEMTGRASTAERRVAQLTKDLEALGDQARRSGELAAEHGKTIDGLRVELRTTTASLKAHKGAATKARNEATIVRQQLSPTPRPIGPMKAPRNEDEAADRAAALEAAFAQDTTQLVFSDGKREICELAPLTITGDAWRERPNGGRVLYHEPLLEPGDCLREQLMLRGFGLLNEAGDQVAYQALNDPIAIGRNQRFMLPHNTIRF